MDTMRFGGAVAMRTGNLSAVSRIALGILVAWSMSCDSRTAAVSDAGPVDVSPGDHFLVDPSWCRGNVQGSGSTPTGTFTANKIDVTVNYDASEIDIVIWDTVSAHSFSLAIPADRSNDAGPVLGTRTLTASYGPPPASFDVVIDLQVIDSPWSLSPQPWGRIQGTFEIASAGYSIVGSFDSAFCNFIATA
ncbi:MAG TPA: hypothetical protein VGP07_01590 [Polyangia bacterium]